jgi:hypothetical protein
MDKRNKRIKTPLQSIFSQFAPFFEKICGGKMHLWDGGFRFGRPAAPDGGFVCKMRKKHMQTEPFAGRMRPKGRCKIHKLGL